ncbi:MAG: tRNA (adenosine(37)-N6)-threonylcarbamoyltransferase complex dimerization subunit type 1 TsaB [Lachnospiraceae bacterium]|nr:tRNA (adenosine(37)-N6)-threonylcarbamoyltransferase complex dimerization subunit type 1 TsaB [Lachnospiraceae bacterium]
MIVLGIESAGLVASAALVGDESILAEYSLNSKNTHSQTLLPMIDEICRAAGIKENMDSIDAIALAAGPGSFTGLRIGAATAKGLSFALKKPVISIPTLDAMAYRLYGVAGLVCPIMDARRSQVYTGVYEFKVESDKTFPEAVNIEPNMVMETVMSQRPVAVAELIETLRAYDKSVTFIGDACHLYRDAIVEGLGERAHFAPCFMSRQSAAAVAGLGMIYMANGAVGDAFTSDLEYLRPSQAERVRDEKLADKKND